MHDAASLYEFVRISEVTATTKHLLALNLQQRTRLGVGRGEPPTTRSEDPVEHLVLQQARDLIGQVREGFLLSARQSSVPSAAELRFLLERVLVDWNALSAELGLGVQMVGDLPASENQELQQVRHQLLAYGMAVAALGFLPRTPCEEVTFPYSFGKPPSYGDIPAPTSAAELLHRIEEIEAMIWRLMSTEWQELVNRHYGPLRRTYAFFEAHTLLANQETRRFGVKKPGSSLAAFS